MHVLPSNIIYKIYIFSQWKWIQCGTVFERVLFGMPEHTHTNNECEETTPIESMSDVVQTKSYTDTITIGLPSVPPRMKIPRWWCRHYDHYYRMFVVNNVNNVHSVFIANIADRPLWWTSPMMNLMATIVDICEPSSDQSYANDADDTVTNAMAMYIYICRRQRAR